MIIDYENELANKQAVTASAATTNVIDFGAARDVATGKPLLLEIICDETVTAAGAATVDFQLQYDSTETFTPDKTVDLNMGVAKGDLTAGTVVYRGSIPEGAEYQYMRGYHTVNTGPLTAGKFSWRIIDAGQTNKQGV